MARSWLARLIAGPPSRGSSRESRRQLEFRQRLSQLGPKPAVERLNPFTALGGDVYEGERKRRQKDIWRQYQSQRREMIRKRRVADRKLQAGLIREEERIRSYYRLAGARQMDKSDPRRRLSRAKAHDAYRLLERRRQRAFREQWQDEEHRLESWRKKQYRGSSRQLREEKREAMGLPRQRQYPWE